MNRRGFLQLTGAATLVLSAAACASSGSTGTLLRSAVAPPKRFSQPLPIPPELVPDAEGVIDLPVQPGWIEIFGGHKTKIRGYGGTFPGPTIRATKDQPLTVRLTNELDRPTVLHLHGGRTPSDSDGFPTDLVQPGTSRDYVYPMQQRAAFLWYHDHTMDATGANVYHGLAGMAIVHDEAEDALGLPTGDRDLPLLICDRSFDAGHQLNYPTGSADAGGPNHGGSGHDHGGDGDHGTGHSGHSGHSAHGGGHDDVVDPEYLGGLLSDVMLVNGAPWPVHEVDAARYRLRLLNASNARRIEISIDEQPLIQVATDQGLLQQPLERKSVTLAQAERVDVLVDFSAFAAGSRVRVRNLLGDGQMADIMEFHVAGASEPEAQIPTELSSYEVPDEAQVSVVRDLHFALGPSSEQHPHGVWMVNGEIFDPDKPLMTLQSGTVERWRLSTDVHHPIHVHLLQMHVVRHRGADPGPAYAGIKDTIDLHPGDTCEVLVPIDGYPGKYVLHCHNLEHEDMMMMSRFDIQ
ncbi:multicopper oxidase family protein [Cumulibacter soli]|uniref:multicopper oxidase family protein n=1 Tax=Cumulibacter soli TaxID=2546344 RepID=UPI001067F11D|nr:multicopper oxidase domain-containing protein [Cumulibacter soli]